MVLDVQKLRLYLGLRTCIEPGQNHSDISMGPGARKRSFDGVASAIIGPAKHDILVCPHMTDDLLLPPGPGAVQMWLGGRPLDQLVNYLPRYTPKAGVAGVAGG